MKYVAWCGQLADSLHTGTPWVMCNGASANNTINARLCFIFLRLFFFFARLVIAAIAVSMQIVTQKCIHISLSCGQNFGKDMKIGETYELFI